LSGVLHYHRVFYYNLKYKLSCTISSSSDDEPIATNITTRNLFVLHYVHLSLLAMQAIRLPLRLHLCLSSVCSLTGKCPNGQNEEAQTVQRIVVASAFISWYLGSGAISWNFWCATFHIFNWRQCTVVRHVCSERPKILL